MAIKESVSKPLTIMDRVKTVEDAFAIKGIKKEDFFFASQIHFSPIFQKCAESAQAFCEMFIVAEVLNEGWTPDWSNTSEYKYYPYHTISGSVLVYYYYCSDLTRTYAGSRPVFKTAALAEYAGKQFLDRYIRMTIIK